MKVFCYGVLAALASLSSNLAVAAALSIGAAPIVWNPAIDGPVSGSQSIELFNSNLDSQLLSNWLLTLEIQPVSATGTLLFDVPPTAPANYILAGNSSGIMGTFTTTSIQAFDQDPSAPFGVSVPASGKFLLDLKYTTPDNAVGTFALVALPGLFSTNWGDSLGGAFEFTNVPFDGLSPVVIGLIEVVPEPSSILLLAAGLASVVAVGMRRLRERS